MKKQTERKITKVRERLANGEKVTRACKQVGLTMNTWYKYAGGKKTTVAKPVALTRTVDDTDTMDLIELVVKSSLPNRVSLVKKLVT